jgi:hypothetical protein
MRIGKRFNCTSADIIYRASDIIPWLNEIRYVGAYFVALCKFKCSFLMLKGIFVERLTLSFAKSVLIPMLTLLYI